ncbi:MAG: hypothetical protein A3F13_00700 [Gammaproteobacteria bacterium RIFCSPHIGHO2_12_FULL_40_19]|nr:MAG: hypothetical protein A3F13_00700 [Gammaproteobacteria bacterium RIFCSPHIGHO2_12_FULL_40_19]
MEAQAIAPAMYEWNDATFHACVAVASITTNKDFNEAAPAPHNAHQSQFPMLYLPKPNIGKIH